MLSIIIPAYNEEADIAACLDALLAQTLESPVQVIVAANGCKDQTVPIAQSYASRFSEKAYEYAVLNIPEGRKTNALNQGDQAAIYPMRAYLDADIVCSPDLFRQIVEVLDRPQPTYASGTMHVAPAKSWASRAYARFWTQLPFITQGVPGAGVYCVNASGRARWGAFPDKFSENEQVRGLLTDAQWQDFPDTFSDDGYVRLLFAPEERFKVEAAYLWPLTEGFTALMRVRRRQDANQANILRVYPELSQNEDEKHVSIIQLLGMALRMPLSFAVYGAIKALNRLASS